MIIIKINDINFGAENKAFYSFTLIFILDLTSTNLTHFKRPPPPHFFLTKTKTIPLKISFMVY